MTSKIACPVAGCTVSVANQGQATMHLLHKHDWRKTDAADWWAKNRSSAAPSDRPSPARRPADPPGAAPAPAAPRRNEVDEDFGF